MKTRWNQLGIAVSISMAGLFFLVTSIGRATIGGSGSPSVNQPADGTPIILQVDPPSAPNDLDAPIVIMGSNLAVLSDTHVITLPTVRVGGTPLIDIGWINSTTLTATLPWGMSPGVYTLTVINPDGQAGSLINAFTVTQGIGVWTTGGPYGGQVVSIAIHPVITTSVYAVASGVGLFRSTDSGANWKLIFADFSDDRVEVSPVSPYRLYTSKSQQGLYRSDDGGDTWSPILVPNTPAFSSRAFAHPTLSSTVYAASDSGLFKSDNAGQTWVTLTNGLTDTRVTALAFDPASSFSMYAGTAHGNVFRSANAGADWEFIGKPDDYINQLAVNPYGAHEVWACGSGFSGQWGYFWKYAADTWSQVLSDTQALQADTLVFDRNISGTLWAATGQGHLKSIDGGRTWADVSALANPLNGTATTVAVDPTNSHILYQGYLGNGIYQTSDGGSVWTQANQGLGGVVPSGLGVAPDAPTTLYATAHGSGVYKTTNGGSTWRQLPGGNTWARTPVVDPVTPTRLYIGRTNGVDITEDDGQHWHAAIPNPPAQYVACCRVEVRSLIATAQPGKLLMGVGFIPNSSSFYTMIAGAFYESTDYGETWSYITTSQVISPVQSMVYNPLSPTVIYAGTNADLDLSGTGIWKSMDTGTTFNPAGLTGQSVSHLAVDGRDPNTVYALSNGTVYVTHNGGQDWIAIASNVQNRLLWVPTTPPSLYAYNWTGLQRSIDGGFTWQAPAGTLSTANIGTMATSSLGDRVAVYVGTAGGTVAGSSVRQSSAGSGLLVSAGVYRQTMRLLNRQVFLPLIRK